MFYLLIYLFIFELEEVFTSLIPCILICKQEFRHGKIIRSITFAFELVTRGPFLESPDN